MNIGYYLERGDNTARLMDVKYYVLLPRVDFVGSGLDNYQWTTLLRAMGAQRAFHWAYGGDVTAAKIADFLIRTAVERRYGSFDPVAAGQTQAQRAELDSINTIAVNARRVAMSRPR